MVAVHLKSFRTGNTNEWIAQAILGCTAFTAPVPRSEDLGVDFTCSLAEEDGPRWKAGPVFAVQVKSQATPIHFKTTQEVEWFLHYPFPYFVGVVRRAKLQLDLYSTWTRVIARLGGGHTNAVVLRPARKPGETPEWPKSLIELSNETARDYWTKTLPLRPHVVSLKLDELASDDDKMKARAAKSVDVLRQWINFDKCNILNADAKIHQIKLACPHETNEPPVEAPQGLRFANRVNITTTQGILRDATGALLAEYEHERPSSPPQEHVDRLRTFMTSVLRGQAEAHFQRQRK